MKTKTRTTDRDWRDALENIENIVSREHIDKLEKDTLEHSREVLNGISNPILSYSGGKDSIVLEAVLRPLGINSIMAYCDLEYPVFMDWIYKHKPENCELINSGQDLLWLANHDNMLFPDNSATAGRWYDIVQHKVQDKIVKERKPGALILGRRQQDGNYCGKDGSGSYMKGETMVFCPLYKWTHEEILAYIHYHELSLPPIYDWPDGYRQGTHNWASYILRDGATRKDALDRLWRIDSSIIIKAKDYINCVKEWYNDYREN